MTPPATTPSIGSRSSATIRTPPGHPQDQQLLRSPATPAREGLLGSRPHDRAIDPSKGERLMALSGATGQDHRRLHRDHAGHAREPGGIPPSGHPKARPGVSDRAAPRAVQPRRGHGARSRAGAVPGKPTRELALLRTVIAQFQPGDIVLADRFFCSYWVIAALQARGVDVVVRLHQRARPTSGAGVAWAERTTSSPGPNRHRSPTGGAAPRTTRGPPS